MAPYKLAQWYSNHVILGTFLQVTTSTLDLTQMRELTLTGTQITGAVSSLYNQ